jgi:transcription-repair coupling factor (superfamily II helicase)
MKDVEDRILSFSCHEYDILISTCIIEAGVDIPDANTVVVYKATSFGLSQLYQIRGRVGRSQVQVRNIFVLFHLLIFI